MFRETTNVLFEQGPHPLSQICELLGEVKEIGVMASGRRVRAPTRKHLADDPWMHAGNGRSAFLSKARFPKHFSMLWDRTAVPPTSI